MRFIGLAMAVVTIGCGGTGVEQSTDDDMARAGGSDIAVTMPDGDMATDTTGSGDMATVGTVQDLATTIADLAMPDMVQTCSCPPMDSCHANICANGVCTHPQLPEGSACNDGSNGTCHSFSGFWACCSGCWDGTTCQPGSQSQACGAAGGACQSCDDGNACTTDQCNSTTGTCQSVTETQYTSCGSNMQCIGTTCTACGAINETCCGGTGGTCGSGLACMGSTCGSTTCGNLSQQCCGGTMCNGTLICAPGQDICWECGKKNHGCCGGVGGTCDPNLLCNQGVCECGASGEPCCGGTGGTCGAGLTCSLNTCH